MSDLGSVLREARIRRRLVMRDVATHVGVSISAVGQWERNEDTPSTDNLLKACTFLKIDAGCALIGKLKEAGSQGPYSDEHIDSQDLAASLDHSATHPTRMEPPFEGAIAQISGRMGGGSTGEVVTIQAGEMQTVEPVAAWWGVPRGFTGLAPDNIAGWPMEGDSMEPTIQRTDVVFIDTRRQSIEPDGIWAVDYGLGRTMKRIKVRKTEGGIRWVLMSDNPRYPPEEYSPEEVTIFGRFLFRVTMF